MTQKSDPSTAALWARFRFSVVGSLLSAPLRQENSRSPWACWPRRPGRIRCAEARCVSRSPPLPHGIDLTFPQFRAKIKGRRLALIGTKHHGLTAKNKDLRQQKAEEPAFAVSSQIVIP